MGNKFHPNSGTQENFLISHVKFHNRHYTNIQSLFSVEYNYLQSNDCCSILHQKWIYCILSNGGVHENWSSLACWCTQKSYIDELGALTPLFAGLVDQCRIHRAYKNGGSVAPFTYRAAARGVQGVQLHPSIFEEDLNCTPQFWEFPLNYRQIWID